MAKAVSPLVTLLTIPEVAEVCRVSTKTVRRWVNGKRLPAARLGNQWRIRQEDLGRFINTSLA